MKLILIVGAPRSGTTLLQTLVACHPLVFTAPETHVFARLTPARLYERNLKPIWPQPIPATMPRQKAVNFLQIRTRKIPEVASINWHARLPMQAHIPLREIAEQLFCLFKTSEGQQIFLEKSPPHVFFVKQARQLFPDARIGNIVRDPRDTIASFNRMLQQRGKQPRPIHELAQVWNQSIQAAVDHDLYTIRYEDLVDATHTVLDGIYQHLDLAFTPSMLAQFKQTAQDCIRKEEVWKHNNLTPMHAHRDAESRSTLTGDQIGLIEGLCASGMRRHGYTRSTSTPTWSVIAARCAYARFRTGRLLRAATGRH